MFPRGIDGLFLPPHEGVEVLALVQRGTPEEAWAARFLPPSRLIAYELTEELGPYPATEELLSRSNAGRALEARGVRALLLSAACTPATRAWADRHGVRLLMVDYDEQRRLEDKVWFDGFLRRHRIPVPDGTVMRFGPNAAGASLAFRGPVVIQARDSMGGEGTYFVNGARDVEPLVASGALRRDQRYLVRRFVEGVAYGITILVAPGRVALSAIRRQCYHEARYSAADQASRVFAGVQWVPSREVSTRLRRRIDRALLRLGDLLYARRAFGFANVDFMVDRDERVLVLECNPRMSAATPQLLHVPELLSGGQAGAAFLRGFLARRVFTRSPARTPVPDTSYEGATLDVVAASATQVHRTFDSGVYRFAARGQRLAYVTPDVRELRDADHLSLVSFARTGQTCKPGDALATIVSTDRLYDADGEMTARATEVSSSFRYTDDRQGSPQEEAARHPAPR